jgi:hypothetical protein
MKRRMLLHLVGMSNVAGSVVVAVRVIKVVRIEAVNLAQDVPRFFE